MRLIQIMQNDVLYSQSTSLNINPKTPSQKKKQNRQLPRGFLAQASRHETHCHTSPASEASSSVPGWQHYQHTPEVPRADLQPIAGTRRRALVSGSGEQQQVARRTSLPCGWGCVLGLNVPTQTEGEPCCLTPTDLSTSKGEVKT